MNDDQENIEGQDWTEGDFTEEEFVDPLEGLVERTEADPMAPFEVAKELADLWKADPVAYAKLRARLVQIKSFRAITSLERLIKQLIREQKDDEGGDEDTQVTTLLSALGEVYLFHSPDDTAYADVTVDGHRETYPVRGGQFKKYLRLQYFNRTNSAPRAESVATAVNTAETLASYSKNEHEVYIRVANLGDRIYLDLGDEKYRVVEIMAAGWSILEVPPDDVRFRRPRGTRALPEPKQGNLEPLIRLQPLYKLLHLAGDDGGYEFVLTVAWILAALRGVGPYPIASMTAEQGSAKSMRARLMRSIFDPHAVLLRSPFREMREGHIAMKNCYTVAVDNLSSLPQWLSDIHCCAATGGGSTYRALYTDEDEAFFDIQRPQILNGIEDIAVRADLADRSIFYTPKPISDDERLPEDELWAAFGEAHPDILGALLDVVAHGLSRIHSIKAKKLPRMADFMKWMLAGETALWPEGTFETAYATNLAEVTATVLALDYVAGAVRDLMLDRQVWADTPTALLAVLREMAGEAATRTPNWPRTAHALSGRLRRAASNLRKIGIKIEFGHDGTKLRNRRIVITAPGEPAAASNESAAKPNGHAADAADAADAQGASANAPQKKKTSRPRGAGAGRGSLA